MQSEDKEEFCMMCLKSNPRKATKKFGSFKLCPAHFQKVMEEIKKIERQKNNNKNALISIPE